MELCDVPDCFKQPDNHQTEQAEASSLSDLLKRKESLKDDFRATISHGMAGYDWVVGKEDFETLLDTLIEKATAF